MYIAEIEVTDLRSFSGTHRVSLERDDGTYAGWTVFAGRNGSGKSTLLKAVAASVVGPLAARSLAGSFPAWVRQGVKVARVTTQLVPARDYDWFQRPMVGATSEESFSVSLEWKANEHGSDILERESKDRDKEEGATQLKRARIRLANAGPWADTPRGWFIAGYGPYRRLGPVTTEVAGVSADPRLSRLVNLYNEAATLSDAIDWLKNVHLVALEGSRSAKKLRDDVVALLGDGLLPDGSAVERVDSKGLWVRRSGVSLPLEQVSDGYRAVAALVVDLVRCLHSTYPKLFKLTRDKSGALTCPLPGVVLIDEVDAHMHVAWQQKIGVWLTRHFPGLQFLVTTHSPFICQAASAKGVIRLPAPDERRTMEHVDDRLFKAIVNGSADDAVMSELFGLEHAHSDKAEALRENLAALEFKLITGKATPAERNKHGALKAQLPDDLGEVADQKLRAVKTLRKRA